MEETAPYWTITITILGIAYPILFQVISRLDEKYTSDHIIEHFNKERIGKFFKFSLIQALIVVAIWSIKFEPLFQINRMNWLINNSAIILLILTTVLLVISFFLFINKILVYYTPSKIIPYLILRHQKSGNDLSYFQTLSDIFLMSIRNQNQNASKTISRFFYTAFKLEREKFKSTPVEYPDMYYELVHKSIEELAVLKEKRNYALEYRTAGGIWLLGELQGNEISEKTYRWLWQNLLLAINYNNDDMIVFHWKTAHQYMTYSLSTIYLDYDFNTIPATIKNKEEVEKREIEQKRFLEFHYALGGLLTYKKRFQCLRRIFDYTTSEPPRYELLPESMDEIFYFFNKLKDPYDLQYPWISERYPFPDQSGLKADSVTKRWIMSYFVILFLRQYTIQPYLITMKPLEYPTIPKTQGEINQWIESMDYFKYLLSCQMEDKELMVTLQLDFITLEWCTKYEKEYPISFVEKLKAKLEKNYDDKAKTMPLDIIKVELFNSTTREILELKLKSIFNLNNMEDVGGDSDKWYVNGIKTLSDKGPFYEDPEAEHLNYNSFLAESLSQRIDEGLAQTFNLKKSNTYLLRDEDIFKGIEKLGVNDNFVIVLFGLNLEYYINHLKVQDLTVSKYKNIKIHSFISSRFVRSSIFILRTTDLPILTTLQIEEERVIKERLKKISEVYNLYTSVIDLNIDEEIRKENIKEKQEEELKKNVLLSIVLSTEIKWKKNIELIQLIEYSEYRQKGLPNDLVEIIPFKQIPNKVS